MTAPAEPTPAAPVVEPTPQAAPAPTPVPAAFDPSALTPEAQAWLQQQISAADLKARTGSKANAAAEARRELTAQLAKTLGLAGDDPPDPEALQRHLQLAQDKAWTRQIELDLYRSVGPDVAARLLDSRSFIDSLDDIEGEPGEPEFDAALKAKAVEAAAKHTAAGPAPAGPRPDPSQGARGAAPTARPTSLTQAFGAHYAGKRAGR